MAARKRKPAIDLGEERMTQRSKEKAIEGGKQYNRLKGFYRVANNDLSGSNPTRGEQEFRHGIGWGVEISKNRRGRVQQRAITQRKNQQRKNMKKGAK